MRIRWFVMGAFIAVTQVGLAGAAPYTSGKSTRTTQMRTAPAAQQAAQQHAVKPAAGATLVSKLAYKTNNNPGHYVTLDHASLPAHGPQRIAVLKQAMEDEIFSRGEFAAHSGENPPFEIVAAGLKETRPSSGERDHAIYELPASALKAGKLDATFLLPVSGHVSAQSTETFAKTNQYNIVVNGKAMPKVAAGGAYVKQHDTAIELKPGKNMIELWPDGSGGPGGYPAGRYIEIHVK